MKISRMTWLSIATVSATLALAGCQKKDQVSVTSEPIAKTEPAKPDPAQALNNQAAPESGTAEQGTAVLPQTGATAPENAIGAAGKETATDLGVASGQARPLEPKDPVMVREDAASAAAERLAKLDARVIDIRAHIDQLSNKPIFTEALTDLRRMHESAQTAIDSIRDRTVKLDDARESSDRRMTQFESAINALQKRVDQAGSETGA